MLLEIIIVIIIIGVSFVGLETSLDSHILNLSGLKTSILLRGLQYEAIIHNANTKLEIKSNILAKRNNETMFDLGQTSSFQANKTTLGFTESGTVSSSGSIIFKSKTTTKKVSLGIGYGPVNL